MFLSLLFLLKATNLADFQKVSTFFLLKYEPFIKDFSIFKLIIHVPALPLKPKISKMKYVYLILFTVLLMNACTKTVTPEDMLSDATKWQGVEKGYLTDGVLDLGSEFLTLVYQPGILNTYTNFEFSTEVLTEVGGHANILFHTNKRYLDQGYAVKIDNSAPGDWDRLLKTGSLSSVRNIFYRMLSDEEWFKLVIRVEENHIQVSVNGYPVVDYIEPEVPFRTPEIDKRRLSAGTFAIETGFGNTGVKFRNMNVSKLPPGEKRQNDDSDFTRQITELHSRHLPLVDFHVHEKGGLTLPLLIEKSAKLGINYGVAANCGLKFPIQNDEELKNYLASIKGMPIFKAMQAEGREWVDMFSPDLVSEFDYAFTDAMTWTNRNGTRMRLWVPEETEVGDPEDFMEQLVSQIEQVVTEPISIYVNPTFLPVEIEDRYDELWTDERVNRVVNSLVKNNVALEINSRTRLPGKKFIAKAKDAGVKFALGTNNTNAENLGKLEWAIEIIEEFNLQPTDMFLPGNSP